MITKRQARRIMNQEIYCAACKRRLSGKYPVFYQTAWVGVYWCGRISCAAKVMRLNCTHVQHKAELERYRTLYGR